MAGQALVIGEALIDIVDGADGASEHVGGSPANVALGLGRQGCAVELLARLGRDDRGERIAAHLEASGVRIHPASWRDAATATALARLQPDGSAQYTFDIAWDVPVPELESVDLVHTGSIALFLEPGGSVVVDALRRARERGIPITVDPNIRPALVGDHDAALARFREVAALSTLVKLSDEDAAWLYPGRSRAEVLAEIVGYGPRAAVVTCGGDGALAVGPGGGTTVAPLSVTVADTIGAGDAYMASLIASLIEDPAVVAREEPFREALERAAVMAGITVSRAGANPPTRAELDAACG